MTQHDEVSGLRDIIKHDTVMDAKAIAKLESLRAVMQKAADDLSVNEIDEIIALIKSTPISNRAPGTLSLGLVIP